MLKLENTTKLPASMRAAKRWLLWKGNKQPFYASGKPRSGALDTPKDSAQLVTYAEALKAMKAHPGRYAGLGFALGDGWQGIDLDGVRDATTGVLAQWAQEIVDTAASYTEISPSGTGLHILCYGTAADMPVLGSNGSGVEFYPNKRYFTVTGERYTKASKVADARHVYDVLLARHGMATTPPVKPPRTTTPVPSILKDAAALLRQLDPDMSYPDWVKVGMGLHHEYNGMPEALDLWDHWSSNGQKYEPGACAKRWAGFQRTDGRPTVSLASIRRMTKQQAAPLKQDDEPDTPPLKMVVVADLVEREYAEAERIIDGDTIFTPGVTVLAGKPKHGKSWAALGWAISAATGESYLNSGPRAPVQAVYVSCDDPSESRFQRRVHAFRPKGKLDGLLLITEIAKKESALALLDELVEQHPAIRFVVIDTLAAFRSGQRTESPYQQEHDEVAALNHWAHKRNIAVLLVHHLRKGEVDTQEPFESISGTLGLQGACDSLMVLVRRDLASDKDSALDEKLAGLWHRGRDFDHEAALGIKLEDGRWSIVGGAADVFSAGTKREIINVLSTDPQRWWTSKEIHAAGSFDCKWQSVQRAAIRMAAKGEITAHRGAVEGKSGGGGGFRLLPVKGETK